MMSFVLAGVVVVLLLATAMTCVIAAGWRREARQRLGDRGDSDERVLCADVADIEARLRRVECEAAPLRDAMIESRLVPLVLRRVPLNAVEAVPELRAVRMRFADGTAFVARGETAGDAGVLAATLRLQHHSMCPARWHKDERGTHVVFDWAGGRRHVAMILVGLEQAA
jgi:hypothetical protein